jgi:hypothetical protein
MKYFYKIMSEEFLPSDLIFFYALKKIVRGIEGKLRLNLVKRV